MRNIRIDVAPEEAQKIVDALSELPYRDVYALIPKVIDQCNKQSEDDEDGD